MKKFLIKVNGNQYEVEVEEIREEGSAVQETPVQNTSQASSSASAANAPAAPKAEAPKKPAGPAGSIKVTAPMPGTILRTNVNPGDSVKKGQVLVILEAMKMENEIVAPSDGTVATVDVTKGTSVNAGDVLVTLN